MRRLFDGGTVAANSERQLLDRFTSSRDELAFEAIVARHGPMVVGVCRSVLSNPNDVDDAFQATFLVLVKKAGSLRDGDHLSPWLHGVARRVALQARALAAKRRDREPLGVDSEPLVSDAATRQADRRELAALIHAEIDRLSAPERSAITLCDLEGLTHQQAADQLGWPLGTVKARVSRGRERLRGRLIRRGVTLPLGLLAATLAGESSASIIVGSTLLAATTRAALAIAASRVLSVGLISAPVVTLTQGAVRAMIFTKLKAVAIALVATTSVLAVPTLVAYQQSPQPGAVKPNQAVDFPVQGEDQAATTPRPEAAKPDRVVTPPVQVAVQAPTSSVTNPTDPTDSNLSLKLELAEAVVKSMSDGHRDRKPVPENLKMIWFHRLAEAQVEAAKTQADRVKAVESYIARIQKITTERSQEVARRIPRALNPSAQENNGMEWESLWGEVISPTPELDQAKEWLTQVKTNPIVASVAPTAVATSGPFGQGGTPEALPRPRFRVKTLPADEKQNQAILAKLEERISMNFPNNTPLSDVLKYIEQCTQDQAMGLPTGIPIYVDPKGLQDADKSMASTIAINLQSIPLRTTLHLLLDQMDLTYTVAGGLLLIEAQDQGPKSATPPTSSGMGFQ